MPNPTPPDPSATDTAGRASTVTRRLWPYAAVACVLFIGIAVAAWLLLTAAVTITDEFVIVSSPSGADVEFDGTALGPSPVKLDRVRVGLHHLRVRKEGFVSFDESVRVDVDRDGPLRIALKPLKPEGSVARTPAEQMDEFRRLANDAFTRGVLVDPYLASALYFGDAILAIDSTDREAVAMRARIRERLLANARKALERREYSRAKALFQQLLGAFPGDPEGVAGLDAARDPARRPLPRSTRP